MPTSPPPSAPGTPAAGSSRIFLLSPASLAGVRGGRILAGDSAAAFMPRLLEEGAVPLGEVFAFISSLYYRGKRSYARRFGSSASGPAVLAITSCRGLVADSTPVSLEELRALAACDIDAANPAYTGPLEATARTLEEELGEGDEVVLLGSIATPKYLRPLGDVFGGRLLVPSAFVGVGDMSRGSLMLQAVEAGEELAYAPPPGWEAPTPPGPSEG